jgi:prohibitin 2
MGWLAGTIIFWLVGGIAFVVAHMSAPIDRRTIETDEGLSVTHIHGRGKLAGYGIAGLMAVGWVALTLASAIHVVDAGHVGVIKTFGKIDGQVGDGPAFIAPWSDLIDVSTKAQRKEFDHLAAFSAETQDVFVDATLNLAVAPSDVQCLYRTVGSDWYDKLIPPRVLQTLKDETVKYSTVNVAPARESIRRDVRKRLQAQLVNFRIRKGACSVSIDVQDFLIRNIDFREEFKQAIERKQIATQDAQTAKNRVAQAQFEADQKAAEAGGEARSTLIKAQAQAKANRLLSNSLTPEIISYTYVQKLAPNVQAIVPDNGQIVVPASIFGK